MSARMLAWEILRDSLSSQTRVMELAWIFDFHTPAFVRVGEKCDFDGVARLLADAGVEAAIFHTKCHYGFSYYPTQVGTPHPRLAADVFGGLIAACRREGIQGEAYLSFGIDGAGGEARPDWRRVYADGSSDPPGWFINVCPFTSYLDERVLPQIEEIFRLYRPDAYWFDTMSALSPCYCAQCRADFLRDAGAELPVAEDDPLQARAGQWRHERGFATVNRVADFIRALDPKASVGFNQLGSLTYPEPVPEGVTVLTLDPDTSGAQSIPFSLNAAYGSNSPLPCEIMPTIFQGGWGDWSPGSPRRLETIAFACWQRGATFIPGDRLHPEGHATELTRSALPLVSTARSVWKTCAPAEDAILAPDVLVLHSPSLTNGGGRRLFAVGDPRSRLTPINGMHRLLLDAGCNFTVAAEWQLAGAIAGISLVVVPELPELDAGTEQRLLDFAENGGTILFVGTLPTVAGRPFQGSGVELGSEVWQDHAYLPPLETGTPEVLVRGAICKAASVGAETVLFLIPAYDARPGLRYGWGIGPSSHEPSAQPALSRQTRGRGTIWFLNAPLASDYARAGNWPQTAWMTQLLTLLVPDPRARLIASGGNLELTVWQNAHSTWLFFLDHENEQLVGEGRLWARSTHGPAPREFAVSISAKSPSPGLAALQATKTTLSKTPTHLTISGEFPPPFGALRIDWQ